MKYLQSSFSSGANSKAYRDNFDKVFPKEKTYLDEKLEDPEFKRLFDEEQAKLARHYGDDD